MNGAKSALTICLSQTAGLFLMTSSCPINWIAVMMIGVGGLLHAFVAHPINPVQIEYTIVHQAMPYFQFIHKGNMMIGDSQ